MSVGSTWSMIRQATHRTQHPSQADPRIGPSGPLFSLRDERRSCSAHSHRSTTSSTNCYCPLYLSYRRHPCAKKARHASVTNVGPSPLSAPETSKVLPAVSSLHRTPAKARRRRCEELSGQTMYDSTRESRGLVR